MSDKIGAYSTASARFELVDRSVVLIALITVAACTAAFLVAGIWVATSGVYDIRGVDINIVYSLQKLQRGLPLYGDPSHPPFEIVQYSPLFYILSTTLLKSFSIPASDIFGIARTARLLGLSFGIATCVMVYFVVSRQLRAGRFAALLAAACVLILTYPWFSLARPDSLMILLLTTSISLGIRLSRRVDKSYALSIACVGTCFLAACAKQNGIISVVPLLLFLAIGRRWRSLIVSLSLLGLLLALAPFAATAIFGHFWKANIVDGIRNGVDVPGALSRTYGVFLPSFWVLCASAIAASWQWITESGDAALTYVGLCPLVFFAEAIIVGLKAGSAVNYFNEFVVVAAIVLAVAGQRFMCGFDAPMLKRTMALCVLLFLPLYTFGQVSRYVLLNKDSGSLRAHALSRYDAFNAVGSYLRRHLGSGGYFVSYILPLCLQLPQQCIVPDPLNVVLANRTRAIDYASLQELSREHRIQYVILPESVTIGAVWHNQPLPGLDTETLELEAHVGSASVFSVRKAAP